MTDDFRKSLSRYLEQKAKPLRLPQDLVLVYAGQIPMAGVWLVEGSLELGFDGPRGVIVEMKGPYLMDELAQEAPFTRSARITKGSLCYLVTRSDLVALTVSA